MGLLFNKDTSGFQFLYSAIDLPFLNLNVVLGLDGLGLVFSALTAFLIPLCILGFWNSSVLFSKDFCMAILLLEGLLFFLLICFFTMFF